MLPLNQKKGQNMSKVTFLKGTAAEYTALTSKDLSTFYHTTDDNQLYLGDIKLSNAADLASAIKDLEGDIKTNSDNITLVTGYIGDLTKLTTTAKSDLVSAIEEIKKSVADNKTSGTITIDTTATTAGAAKSYTIKQGDATVGVIDIPKDMVVQSGTVEVNPEGQPAGTYLVLTLANATSDKIYINATTLVDIYTAEKNATQIQLKVTGNEISASVVAGSIDTTELADDAVVTAKIADGNVTKAKLETAVQTSLGKADSAVQTVATGTANGTIAVDGTDVAVAGLKSAAYADTTAFDAAGAAATAETNAKAYTDTMLTWGAITGA